MSAIARAFAQAAAKGRRAFIPYLTGGWPNRADSAEMILALDAAGADVIEVGLPFSDPLADGPVIQQASKQALDAGVSTRAVLEMAAELSPRVSAPLVLMTYYNPVHRLGLQAFAERAAAAGAAGVIIPDLPPEEAGPWVAAARTAGLDTIFLATPTTDDGRLEAVLRVAGGFLYYVSITGVTGAGLQVGRDLLAHLDRVRAAAALPVAVGFGVATPDQAAALAPAADGVIVGSALIKLLAGQEDQAARLAAIADYTAGMLAALAWPAAQPTVR